MIDNNNSVKIIDFGFGKQLNGTNAEANSVLLNWPATEMPDEVQLNQEYDERTEHIRRRIAADDKRDGAVKFFKAF